MPSRRLLALALLALPACRAEPPVSLEPPRTVSVEGAADPTVAIDARSGTTYLAWAAQAPDSTWDLVVARRDSGAFGAPVRVNRVAGEVISSNQFPPQVRVGDDGVVYVAWLMLDQAKQVVQIRVSRSRDGGATFDSAATLGATEKGPVPSLYYDLGVGPSGRVYVSWLDLSRYSALEAERAANKASGPAPPVEADLRFAISTDRGLTFTTLPSLDSTACICCRAAVTGGSDGTAYLMWRHVYPGDERDVVVASAPAGGTVSAPVRVHADHWQINGCPEVGPSIGIGVGGTLHVAWYTAASGRQGLHYSKSVDGGKTFDPPHPILVGPSVPTALVRIAVAESTAWLAWEEPNPTEARLRLGRVVGDAVVAEPEPIGVGRAPAIATGHGQIAVVWADNGKLFARLGILGKSDGGR